MNPNRRTARRQAGVTLVEMAVVCCITAVLASVAVPSFRQAAEHRHIEGAAAQLETDFQYARSSAVARSEVVRVGFEAAGGESCYVVHTGDAGDCVCAGRATPVCSAGAVPLHTVRLSGVPVRLQSNSRSVGFEPLRGMVTPTATVQVVGASGAAVHQVINVMGRVRSCTPNGLPGYRAC
jgi:type IV fimbrial biogenesis protein FimT